MDLRTEVRFGDAGSYFDASEPYCPQCDNHLPWQRWEATTRREWRAGDGPYASEAAARDAAAVFDLPVREVTVTTLRRVK